MSPRRARALEGRAGDDPAASLRDHLIEVAEELTSRAPATSITTRDIARAAGVSDGVLYNYFADKNDLLIAAMVRRYLRLFDRFAACIPAPGSDTVANNVQAIADRLVELEREFVPLVAGLVVDPPLLHRFFVALHADPHGPQQFFAPLVEYLAAEQRLGRLRGDADLEAISVMLLGSTAVLVLAGHVAPVAVTFDADRVRPIVTTLLRGFLPAEIGD